jgi:septal ring factor EnvC (AmiA/AmiB activator)
MASNLSSWFFPALLTIGCIALVMNIMNAKKMNKSLLTNIDSAQAEMKVAMDSSMECSKQLEMKTSDMTAKDQQLASLTANVDTLTQERNNIQEQLEQLQEQLENVNADKDAIETEKNQLANDIEMAIGNDEGEPKDEAKVEEAP